MEDDLILDISIHALLAESDSLTTYFDTSSMISIHALLAESDSSSYSAYLEEGISIHALLAESDKINPASQTNSPDFYPRSPCGERPVT